MNHLPQLRSAAEEGWKGDWAKSCIYIFLSGGLSSEEQSVAGD
jgi:hypothetical protein